MFTVGPWAGGGESWLKLVNLDTEADFSKDSNFLLKNGIQKFKLFQWKKVFYYNFLAKNFCIYPTFKLAS